LIDREPDLNALIDDCFEHPSDNLRLGRFFAAVLPFLKAALVATYPRDLSIVEDAIQSSLIKYLDIFRRGRKRDSGGRDIKISEAYFLVVARNCLIDEVRRRKGRVALDEVGEAEYVSIADESALDREARMLALNHAMLQLDRRCQYILDRYYIQELDSRSLAAQLGISPESVYMAIKRCRDKLRELLVAMGTS
jgi:RNA polymerase sigma factor (sigma-70 family)